MEIEHDQVVVRRGLFVETVNFSFSSTSRCESDLLREPLHRRLILRQADKEPNVVAEIRRPLRPRLANRLATLRVVDGREHADAEQVRRILRVILDSAVYPFALRKRTQNKIKEEQSGKQNKEGNVITCSNEVMKKNERETKK